MRKRTSTRKESASKKQKVQVKEIYSHKQYDFREFDTPSIGAFCLHTTEPLIAVAPDHNSNQRSHRLVLIYTLDGDPVTKLEVSNPEKIFLSSAMMVTSNEQKTLTRYNDNNVINAPLHFSSFDCDVNGNGNIYALPISWIYCKDDEGNSNIDIYSPDLEYVKPFKVAGLHYIISFRIQGDYIVIFNYSSPRTTVLRYSLSTAEHIQTVRIDASFLISYTLHIAFDPLNNVILSCHRYDKYAVWYFGARYIRYYKPQGRSVFSRCYAITLEITKNFELVRAMNIGSMRVYSAIPVSLE